MGPQRLGMIGYGAVAQAVVRHLAPYRLESEGGAVELQAILVSPGGKKKDRPAPPDGIPLVDNLGEFLAMRHDLVVECAGQQAVRMYAEQILRAGADLIAISMGAFADEALLNRTMAAAKGSGTRVIIPTGAAGGLDILAAVRHDGIERVLFRSTKLPRAWMGTAAEAIVDLPALKEPVCFYRGNAREAARSYPQSANVAAAVALAGIGFDRTEVELVADPAAGGNRNEIMAHGPFGSFEIKMLGKTRPEAPRTSISAPVSVVRSVLNRASGFAI